MLTSRDRSGAAQVATAESDFGEPHLKALADSAPSWGEEWVGAGVPPIHGVGQEGAGLATVILRITQGRIASLHKRQLTRLERQQSRLYCSVHFEQSYARWRSFDCSWASAGCPTELCTLRLEATCLLGALVTHHDSTYYSRELQLVMQTPKKPKPYRSSSKKLL